MADGFDVSLPQLAAARLHLTEAEDALQRVDAGMKEAVPDSGDPSVNSSLQQEADRTRTDAQQRIARAKATQEKISAAAQRYDRTEAAARHSFENGNPAAKGSP